MPKSRGPVGHWAQPAGKYGFFMASARLHPGHSAEKNKARCPIPEGHGLTGSKIDNAYFKIKGVLKKYARFKHGRRPMESPDHSIIIA
jgi:hypothetical protein